MKRSFILFLLGGFFYSLLCSLYLSKAYTVKAKVIEIVDDGYISYMEEDHKVSDNVLSDSIKLISEVEDEDQIHSSEIVSNNSEDFSYSEVSDDMNNVSEFHIMCVFGFGLIVGVIVGHFLTGFIK